MIPASSNFPDAFDTDDNLYLVHDSLRLKLAEDYYPGDTKITIEVDDAILAKFPPTGIITLTEQASDIDQRAISFYYSEKGDTYFSGLTILDGFEDVLKPKRITDVTQNVVAEHHNNLKDTLIAIEEYLGVKGTTDTRPFGDTLEGRLNFLLNKVLTPKAWFVADNSIGLAPLKVEFSDQSLRTEGTNAEFIWNFDVNGNNTISNISVIEMSDVVDQDGVLIKDTTGDPITKSFTTPGKYDVALTVNNDYGTDTVTFKDFVTVLHPAPDEAKIIFTPRSNQIVQPANATGSDVLFDRLATSPSAGYDKPPAIRSTINNFIDLNVPDSEYENTHKTYAGESLNNANVKIDPIITYTWSLSDDLIHGNSNQARASYSVGGLYDLRLRVDTKYGSYRITKYENCIDILEKQNLWLFTSNSSQIFTCNEYGLISETFKTASAPYTISRNDSFLTGIGSPDVNGIYQAEIRAKREFKRNTGFTNTSSSASGDQGTALLFWAGGGDNTTPLANQPVNAIEYEGFSDVYSQVYSGSGAWNLTRPWNWAFLPSGSKGYFIFGPDPDEIPNSNDSYQQKSTVDFASGNVVTNSVLTDTNYLSGSGELVEHVTSGYTAGEPNTGRFAVYRTTWKDQTGYILRNGGSGAFFRLNSFYQTEGTISEPFINIKKLPDMAGPTKVEGTACHAGRWHLLLHKFWEYCCLQ